MKNTISISFTDGLLSLRINNKLRFADRKIDVGESYWDEFIGDVFKAVRVYLDDED
jgi:hypothetical protein